MLVCLSGHQHSGKDTVADIMCENDLSVKLAFADPIKRIVKEIYGFSEETLWGESSNRNFIDPFSGLIARDTLKAFGDIGRKLNENTWVNKTLEHAKELEKKYTYYNRDSGIYECEIEDKFRQFVIITDGRYLNELSAVRNVGGKLVRIKRSSNTYINLEHSSELSQTEISDDFFDFIINNSGTLYDLRVSIDNLILELKKYL